MNATMKSEPKTYREFLSEPFPVPAAQPAWLLEIRKKAQERFAALGVPTRKEEAWKYLHLDTLLQHSFEPALKANFVDFAAAKKDFSENRIVFFDGFLDKAMSDFSGMAPATVTTYLGEELDWAKEFLAQSVAKEENPFVLINTALFQEGVFIYLPENTVLEKPVHFVFYSAGGEIAPVFYPRILVVAEAGTKADFIFDHIGLSKSPYFMNSVVEFCLAPNANIQCLNLQREQENAVQFFNARAYLQENSRFDMVTFVDGGKMIRDEALVDFLAPGAYSSLSALSVLDGASQAFHHTQMNHRVPDCMSRQVYKNILAGKSVAEFNSLVHVWRGADRSDAVQVDRNLLLSDEARIYSRPQLKIDADDVKASHGAATGQLEKNELFYLRSRGIEKQLARFLLTYGFAKEIIDAVRPAPLRDQIDQLIQQQIKDMIAEASKASKG